jgi:hypothetical protein
VDRGKRHGIFAELARHDEGLPADDLAGRRDLDDDTKVVARTAFAGSIVDRRRDRYVLDPDMATPSARPRLASLVSEAMSRWSRPC